MSTHFAKIALVSVLLLVTAGCGSRSRKAREKAAAAAEAAAKAKAAASETKLPPRAVTLPAGTRFSVRMMLPAQQPQNPNGVQVEGELAAPISAFTETVFPRATTVVAIMSTEGGDVTIRATKFKVAGGTVLDVTSDAPRLAPSAKQAGVVGGGEMMSIGSNAVLSETLVAFRLKEPLQVTIQP